MTITALWRDMEEALEITEPGELCLTRADLQEEPILEIDEPLAPGDILATGGCRGDSLSDYDEYDQDSGSNLLVELSCGEGTVLRFGGGSLDDERRRGFKALIREPETTECAVELVAGTLDIHTDRPTEAIGGGVTIGVEGTHLTLSRSLQREGTDERLTCLLFDGQASIDADDSAQAIVLEPGEGWSRIGTETTRGEIDVEAFIEVAERYAQLDAGRAYVRGTLPQTTGCDPCVAVNRLLPLYAMTLSQPFDKSRRVALARTLLEFGLGDRARLELHDVGLAIDQELQGLEIDSDPIRPFGVGGAVPAFVPQTPPVSNGQTTAVPAILKLYLPTELGGVFVFIPADLRRGEQISGTLELSGSGHGSTRRKNLAKLKKRSHLAIAEEKIPLEDGIFSLRLPATGQRLEVALKNRGGKSLASKSVDFVEPGTGTPGTELLAPPTFCSGKRMTIAGPFDGDSRTTRIVAGDEPVPVLAETVRGVAIACPEPTGRLDLRVEEGDEQLGIARFYAFDLDWNVLKSPLAKGDVSAAILRLRGLAGLEGPIGVRIVNTTPDIARLEGGDDQLLTFSPADWGDDGIVTRTLQVVGRRPGKTRFDVKLVPLQPLEP